MEIKINKEIMDYHEGILLSLNFREILFSVLAIGVSAACYFGLGSILGQDLAGWVALISAALPAAFGFWTPTGLPLEKFVWAVIQYQFIRPKIRVFRADNFYDICAETKMEVEDETLEKGKK